MYCVAHCDIEQGRGSAMQVGNDNISSGMMIWSWEW